MNCMIRQETKKQNPKKQKENATKQNKKHADISAAENQQATHSTTKTNLCITFPCLFFV